MTEKEDKFIKELNKKPYKRLCNSKLPIVNFHQICMERVVNDLEYKEIGFLITVLYEFIYEGKIYIFNTKRMESIWDNLLTKINKSAEWWFKKKDEEQQSKKLNISKDDINSVFKTEGNYIGKIDNKQE